MELENSQKFESLNKDDVIIKIINPLISNNKKLKFLCDVVDTTNKEESIIE